MWATGMPRQNVDMLWRLREELLRLGVKVVFFFKENAKPMLRAVLAEDSRREVPPDIYQLDEVRFFRLLNFIEVLVPNDYRVNPIDTKYISAKIVILNNCYNMENP